MGGNVHGVQHGQRMELYVPREAAPTVISIAQQFNLEAKVTGYVEASDKGHVTIKSPYGTFSYTL